MREKFLSLVDFIKKRKTFVVFASSVLKVLVQPLLKEFVGPWRKIKAGFGHSVPVKLCFTLFSLFVVFSNFFCDGH